MKIHLHVFAAVLAVALATFALVSNAHAGPVLDRVKAKDFVQCGVSHGMPGFSAPDNAGNWTGIDVDVCRGIAAALFGDSNKVRYSPLSENERITALQGGEIDVLSGTMSWTLARDTALGLNFPAVTYYDGQGFMARKSLSVGSALELDRASVCIKLGTKTELNLFNYFRANNMKFKGVFFEKAHEVIAAYDAGRCDVYTTNQSALAAQRTKLKNPGEHILVPEIFSKEPLGPVIVHGDDQWFEIIQWTLFAMLDAEENGVSSKNVDELKAGSNSTAHRRLLGAEGNVGKTLGLNKDWAYNIVKQVGNYGEIFDKNLGPNTSVNLPRGLNNLWNKGGIQYPLPAR